MKSKIMALSGTTYHFIKRNSKELKVISAPFAILLAIFFAFSGFLMNDIMHPYFVSTSRIITLILAGSLLLYCIWDLINSAMIIPVKNILDREKNK